MAKRLAEFSASLFLCRKTVFSYPYFEGNCINIGEKFRQSLTSSYKHAVKHAKIHSIVALPWCCKLKFELIFNEVEAINDNPYFVGKDVATILGYAKPLNAIAIHVDEDDSLKQGLTDSMGRIQETIVINESGLYSRTKFVCLVLKVANLSALTS